MLPQNKRPSRLPPAPPPTAASHRPPALSKRAVSVVPPAPVPTGSRKSLEARPSARPAAASRRDAGDDDVTRLQPSARSGALSQPPVRGSLLDLGHSDDGDEDATQLFDGKALKSARVPVETNVTLAAAGITKKTLSRNPHAVEDDIQQRASLAVDTDEYVARGRRPSVAPPVTMQPAPRARESTPAPRGRESTPAPRARESMPAVALASEPNFTLPAAGMTPPTPQGSRRPQRAAPSNDRAFQRTEAEVSQPFVASGRSLPSVATSLPAGSFSASGEQIAALISPAPPRKAASWFMALGAAVVLVIGASSVFLRNPSTALAASALADPVASPNALTADLPAAAPPAAAAPPPSAVAVAPPPPAAPPVAAPVPAPQYVPGSTPPVAAVAEPVAPPEPIAAAPADARSHRHSAPAAPAPTPAAKKADPPAPAAKKVAAAPAPEPKKKGKNEQSDDERKASEEAARLAKKQLDDQL